MPSPCGGTAARGPAAAELAMGPGGSERTAPMPAATAVSCLTALHGRLARSHARSLHAPGQDRKVTVCMGGAGRARGRGAGDVQSQFLSAVNSCLGRRLRLHHAPSEARYALHMRWARPNSQACRGNLAIMMTECNCDGVHRSCCCAHLDNLSVAGVLTALGACEHAACSNVGSLTAGCCSFMILGNLARRRTEEEGC